VASKRANRKFPPKSNDKELIYIYIYMGGSLSPHPCENDGLDFQGFHNNKEISSRELRILQVHFPSNSVLKSIRKHPPRRSRSSRSNFPTVPYQN
jgi:hypothetical protein